MVHAFTLENIAAVLDQNMCVGARTMNMGTRMGVRISVMGVKNSILGARRILQGNPVRNIDWFSD